jgi:hypothetical protein
MSSRGSLPPRRTTITAVPESLVCALQRVARGGVVTLATAPEGATQFTPQGKPLRDTFRVAASKGGAEPPNSSSKCALLESVVDSCAGAASATAGAAE